MEENNQYAEAEEYGMQAINMNPNDAWGLHALVHVYEMQSRVNEGKRLLGEMKVSNLNPLDLQLDLLAARHTLQSIFP